MTGQRKHWGDKMVSKRTGSGWGSEALCVDDGAEGVGDLLVLEVLAKVLVLQGLIPVRLLQEQLRVSCVQNLLVP